MRITACAAPQAMDVKRSGFRGIGAREGYCGGTRWPLILRKAAWAA